MKREKQTLSRKAAAILVPLLALLAAFLLAMTTLVATPDEAQAASSSETQTMYRLYNPFSGEHFYTASAEERNATVTAGWDYEGRGWVAPKTSSTPVYRLYSGTDHHYTTSAAERDMLIKAGWSDEGVGWYSDDAEFVPLYRQFNPNVNPSASRNNSGSHNYTTSKGENDSLVAAGWQAEGIGWYGCDPSGVESPSCPCYSLNIPADYAGCTVEYDDFYKNASGGYWDYNDMRIGYMTSVKNSHGRFLFSIGCYSDDWGPQGDLVSLDLGPSSVLPGTHVWIDAATGYATESQLAAYASWVTVY